MSRVGRTLIGVGVAAAAVGLLIAHTSSNGNTGSPADLSGGDVYASSLEPSPSPTVAVLSAVDAAKQHDKGWVLETYRLRRDEAGAAQMTARIKNANDVQSTAAFTVTMLNGETPLMTWQGSAFKVAGGATVTVQLLTTDPLPPDQRGSFHMQFQVDSSVPD